MNDNPWDACLFVVVVVVVVVIALIIFGAVYHPH